MRETVCKTTSIKFELTSEEHNVMERAWQIVNRINNVMEITDEITVNGVCFDCDEVALCASFLQDFYDRIEIIRKYEEIIYDCEKERNKK